MAPYPVSKDLAACYGLCYSTVRDIELCRTWKHVEPDP
jgi:hypothetical protein